MIKVLRNGLLRYILHTCPHLWCNPCSKCYGVDCFGTYFTHVQSCDVIVFKVLRSGLLRYILHTCPKLWCNPCSKCYGMDCFRYILHTCPKLQCNPCSKCYGVDCSGTYFTHVQSCDVTRVQSATEWLLRYILHTCPKLWWNQCSKCYAIDCCGILHCLCFGPLISVNRSVFLAWMSKYMHWHRSFWF